VLEPEQLVISVKRGVEALPFCLPLSPLCHDLAPAICVLSAPQTGRALRSWTCGASSVLKVMPGQQHKQQRCRSARSEAHDFGRMPRPARQASVCVRARCC
jgi:hypothetical protein